MTLSSSCCDCCRDTAIQPCAEQVDEMTVEAFCEETDHRGEKTREAIAQARRVPVTTPTVYVGAGTCGIGAGAGGTLEVLRTYLADRAVVADVVEVGCIGLCSAEPMVDIQLPGRARLSFTNITREHITDLMDAVLAGDIPADKLLGQHRSDDTEPYADVPYVDEHPFFAPQTRWVLANCGMIDPGSIDEYIAEGGYRAFSDAIRTLPNGSSPLPFPKKISAFW